MKRLIIVVLFVAGCWRSDKWKGLSIPQQTDMAMRMPMRIDNNMDMTTTDTNDLSHPFDFSLPQPIDSAGADLTPAPVSPWVLEPSGNNMPLTSVWGASSTEIWVAGWGSTVLHTTNGGTLWNAISTAPYVGDWISISSTGSGAVYACDSGTQLIHTADQGSTWNALNGPTGLRQVLGQPGLVFVLQTSSLGYLIGSNLHPFNVGDTAPMLSIGTANGGNLYVVGQSNQVFYSIGNAGSKWTSQPVAPAVQQWKGVGSALDITYIVGDNGLIAYTSDNGTSWKFPTQNPVSGKINISLTAVQALYPAEAFVIGYDNMAMNGIILHSIDGGQTWLSESIPTTNALYGIWGDSAHNVFAVGVAGTIIHRH
jgi:photosystem II stability/assembly factor-like uncharacterized protein